MSKEELGLYQHAGRPSESGRPTVHQYVVNSNGPTNGYSMTMKKKVTTRLYGRASVSLDMYGVATHDTSQKA